MTFHRSQEDENKEENDPFCQEEIAIINREDPVLWSPSQDKRERQMVVKYRISSKANQGLLGDFVCEEDSWLLQKPLVGTI